MFSKRSVKTGAEAAYELKRRGDNTDTKLCSYSLSLSLFTRSVLFHATGH